MTTSTRIDWKIPLALLVASVVPFVAGIVRLVALATGGDINADNARFFAVPVPAVLHIVGASVFSILGALQFSTWLRVNYPQWHRASGRLVVASGVVAAISGAWLTTTSPIPAALQGDLLYCVRLVVATAMLVAIAAAVIAVSQRDFPNHRNWMIRAYALGQGAGTQVVIFLPWVLLIGEPTAHQRDVLMSLAWLINLCIAEWVINQLRPKTISFNTVSP